MRGLLLSLLFVCLSSASPEWNPVANPAAQVFAQQARFTVLTPSLIRMEYSDAKTFEDRATIGVVNRFFKDVPRFVKTQSEQNTTIETSTLTLIYTGGPFTSDSLQIKRRGSNAVLWSFGQEDKGNLLGTVRTLDGANGAVQLDCKQQSDSQHCTYGVVSRDGWAVVDDTKDMRLIPDSVWEHWFTTSPSSSSIDQYFFGHGNQYKQALKDYTLIGGQIPLPPRYAFGVWFSRYWAYSDVELKDVVAQYEKHETPLDVLVTDMDWHITFYKEASQGKRDPAGETPGWTGWTWDKNLFPNSTEFLEFCKGKGLRNTLNIHPASGIQPYEERYEQMAIASGINPSTQQYVPFDITNRTFAENLHDIMLRPIWNEGIDFWWLDWQQGENTAVQGLNPTIWLNHVFWKNFERQNLETRPTVFHRWGGLGNHRYPIGFSGDVVPSWASLSFQPYFTATASNVGYAFWSHDLGGHTEPSPPELYTRWIQWGLFAPVFRPHCTKNPDNDRRIWTYPLVNFNIMRDAMVLRSSLVPHIYTLARQTHDTGVGSIVSPLYYNYPDEPQSYTYTNEFMWGDDVVVAPVASPVDEKTGLADAKIFLPKGSTWVNWFTGKVHNATQRSMEVASGFTLSEIPAYVKAGSIITYWPPSQKSLLGSAFNAPQVLGLQAFVDGISDKASGELNVYEDAGDDKSYLNGQFSFTKAVFKQMSNALGMTVNPPTGNYPAGKYNYEFKFTGTWAPTSVVVNGQSFSYTPKNTGFENGWRYDGDTLSIIVNLVNHDRSEPIKVVVGLPKALDAEFFDGVSGLIKRAKDAKALIDYQWNINTIFQEDYNLLIQISEIGSVMTANPASSVEVLSGLPALKRNALQQLASINYGNVELARTIAVQIENL